MAICELLSHFSVSCMNSLHPWVAQDISYCKSLVEIELEHACDQVFEILSEEAWFVLLIVTLPEKISSSCCQ